MRAMILIAMIFSPLTAGNAEEPAGKAPGALMRLNFFELLPRAQWGAPCTIADDWEKRIPRADYGTCNVPQIKTRKGHP